MNRLLLRNLQLIYPMLLESTMNNEMDVFISKSVSIDQILRKHNLYFYKNYFMFEHKNKLVILELLFCEKLQIHRVEENSLNKTFLVLCT